MRNGSFLRVLTASLALGFAVAGAAGQSGKPARVVLPPKLIAGQAATLAVLDENGRLLPECTVSFTGAAQVTTDETGRAIFTAPSQHGVLIAEARSAEGSARASAVVAPAPPPSAAGLVLTEVPSLITQATEFFVGGAGFRGEADANEVLLGGKPAIIVASSPASLVVVPPTDVEPGATEMRFTVGPWTQGPNPVSLVALAVTAEPERVGPGKKGRLTVRARGVESPVEIVVTNHTPEILEFPGAEASVRLMTSGGADNSASMEVRGRSEGDYSVEVRLVAAASGAPDTTLAHRELKTAHGIATGETQKAVGRLLKHLEEHPHHYLDVRNELERMLAALPRGELQLRLETAWRALLRK